MIHYTIEKGSPLQQKTDILVLPVWEGENLPPLLKGLKTEAGHSLEKQLEEEGYTGKMGKPYLVRAISGLSAPRLLLLGAGKRPELTGTPCQNWFAQLGKQLQSLSTLKSAAIVLPETPHLSPNFILYQGILTLEQQYYRFDRFKSKKEPELAMTQITLLSEKAEEEVRTQAVAVAKAVALCKNLGNLPSNICTPSYLAEQAKQLSQTSPALKLSIIDKEEAEKLGMNAFLAVAKGSDEPPKFIILEYKGSEDAPIALIGKGITFDSGGISLKPGAGMDEMCYDMCGAASVLACLSAAVELKLPLHLVGIMVCTENMPSGHAYKPGDIVTTLSGKTIEILNTDAEGRVVLADALCYVNRFKPSIVIDIATLTGAIIIALGDKATGLLTQDEKLADALIEAGQTSWDRVWPLPLWEEYQEQIKSPFADMANIGSEGGKSITAACLLSRFAENYRWAHLDIAGTAWQSGKNKMATGRPVPLLMQFLLNQCKVGQ